METVKRRSLLQLKILVHLAERPANSVAELADRLKTLRPSVSRSLKGLKAEGLVHRNRRSWRLTKNGEAEAKLASRELVQTVEQASATVTRAFKGLPWDELRKAAVPRLALTLPNPVESVPFSGAIDLVKLGFTNSLSEAIDRMIPGVSLTPDTVGLDEFARQLSAQAMAPLIQAQEANAAVLKQLVSSLQPSYFEVFARENNVLLTKAINDLFALRHSEIKNLATQAAMGLDLGLLSAHLADVGQAYLGLFRDQLRHINTAVLADISPVVGANLVTPTATVAYYADSMRYLVEAEAELTLHPIPQLGLEEYGDGYLDPLLRKLDPNWVEMRQACWFVLRAGGPDRLRHAATSQRELFAQVLRRLVPNLQLPEDAQKGPQIKARIKLLMDGSDTAADFVQAVTNAVYHYYGLANKFVHANEKHEASLRAMLRVGEGLLLFILVQTFEG